MNTNRIKAITAIVATSLMLMLGFQNCANVSEYEAATSSDTLPSDAPNPISFGNIFLVPSALSVLEGEQASLTFNFDKVRDLGFFCKDRGTGETLLSGYVVKTGDSVQWTMDRDLHCQATGTSMYNRQPLQKEIELLVDCGARIKNPTTTRCEDPIP